MKITVVVFALISLVSASVAHQDTFYWSDPIPSEISVRIRTEHIPSMDGFRVLGKQLVKSSSSDVFFYITSRDGRMIYSSDIITSKSPEWNDIFLNTNKLLNGAHLHFYDKDKTNPSDKIGVTMQLDIDDWINGIRNVPISCVDAKLKETRVDCGKVSIDVLYQSDRNYKVRLSADMIPIYSK